MIDLDGKTASLAGSSSGIGFAIVQGLLAAGATVALEARAPGRADAAIAKLAAEHRPERARPSAPDPLTVRGSRSRRKSPRAAVCKKP